LRCNGCGETYVRGPEGYLSFPTLAGGADEPVGERLEAYAQRQESGGERFVERFLAPYLSSAGVVPGAGSVLDAGCGLGEGVGLLADAGVEAFGIDLPKLAPLWRAAGRDPARFVTGDVTALPFRDGAFSVVTSFGVIEHVGTLTGHLTLAPDAEERRRRFAHELTRVVGRGGRVLIACPNKAFPIDLHHGPTDDLSPNRPVRSAVSQRTGVSIHPTWGRHALVSFGDVRRLFAPHPVRPVPPRGYFGFGNVPGWLRGAARAYVEHLPGPLRASAANPFVIAEVSVLGG
jgi:SAM-dependent methyltransferase